MTKWEQAGYSSEEEYMQGVQAGNKIKNMGAVDGSNNTYRDQVERQSEIATKAREIQKSKVAQEIASKNLDKQGYLAGNAKVDGSYAAKDAGKTAGTGMDAGGYAQVAKMGMDAKGVGGANDDSTGGGVAQGAVGGAATGFAVGGPWGAAIGAVAGGVMGAAGAAAKRKAKNRAIEGEKHAALANIEQTRGKQLNSVFESMAANMRLR